MPIHDPPQSFKPRGGRRSKDKGSRVERQVVNDLRTAGLRAERVPLSGALGGKFSGDITVPLCGRMLTLEVKARARGFAQIYQWLDARDALIVRADRKPALVILPLTLASEIAAAAEISRGLTASVEQDGKPASSSDAANMKPAL